MRKEKKTLPVTTERGQRVESGNHCPYNNLAMQTNENAGSWIE